MFLNAIYAPKYTVNNSCIQQEAQSQRNVLSTTALPQVAEKEASSCILALLPVENTFKEEKEEYFKKFRITST